MCSINIKGIDEIPHLQSGNISSEGISRIFEKLRDIENPSKEVQLAVVKQDGRVIEYIENPSEEIQLAVHADSGIYSSSSLEPSKKIDLIVPQDWKKLKQYLLDHPDDINIVNS